MILDRVTLDEAVSTFNSNKSARTASDLLTVATKYWHDEKIDDASYWDVIRPVRDWLDDQANAD